MSKKNKTRRLWLNVKFKTPKRVSEWKIKETLLRSIEEAEEKEYALPKGWDVLLEWRNKEDAEMRSGLWSEELSASAESSDGFDLAVTDYLNRWQVEPKKKRKRKGKRRGKKLLVRRKARRITHRPGSQKRKTGQARQRRAKAKKRNRVRTPKRA